MSIQGSNWIIRTKLSPPSVSINLVERIRLTNRFSEYERYRLSIVHALAGYGKTTLLRAWFDYCQGGCHTAVWVSLDESENNINEFYAYLVASLAAAGVCSERLNTLSLQDLSNMPSRILASAVIEAVENQNTLVYLLLDDYYRASSEATNALLQTIITYAPVNLRIVLATRVYPSFSLENLRSQGHVLDIGVDDLEFDTEELSALFGNGLSDMEVSLLLSRTEGWPIACQMASYLIHHRQFDTRQFTEFSGNNLELSLYISEQIFDGLSPEEKRFLTLSSAVDRFSGELIAHLDKNLSVWPILERLERRKLFLIPLDTGNSWFRYHHMLGEYFYEKLKRHQGNRVKDIHRSASNWLFHQGHIPEAVEQAFRAEDLNLASRIINQAGGWRLAFQGKLDFLRSFLGRIPRHIVDEFPRLLLAHLVVLIRDGKDLQARDEAASYKARSQNFLSHAGVPIEEAERIDLEVVIDVLLEMYADTPTTTEKISDLNRILNKLDSGDSICLSIVKESLMCHELERGNVVNAEAMFDELHTDTFTTYGLVYSHIDHAIIYSIQAKFSDAEAEISKARAIVDRYPAIDTNLNAAVSVFLAEIDYYRNHLSRAKSIVEFALAQLEKYDAGFIHYVPAFTAMMGIARVTGDRQSVVDIKHRAIKVAESRRLPRLKTFASLLYVRFLLLAGNLSEAQQQLDQLGSSAANPESPSARDLSVLIPDLTALTQARLLLAQRQPQTAAPILESLLQRAEEQGRKRVLIEVYLLLSITMHQMENLQRSVDLVKQAVLLSMHEGYRRVFIDEGSAGVEIYESALSNAGELLSNQYFARFLKEVIQETKKEMKRLSSRTSGLSLTDMEYDVVAQLAKGLSNKEIARELNISVETVKYRLKKIFRKWNVSSRNEAARRAQSHFVKSNQSSA